MPPEYAFSPGSSIDTNIVNDFSDSGAIPTKEAGAGATAVFNQPRTDTDPTRLGNAALRPLFSSSRHRVAAAAHPLRATEAQPWHRDPGYVRFMH